MVKIKSFVITSDMFFNTTLKLKKNFIMNYKGFMKR